MHDAITSSIWAILCGCVYIIYILKRLNENVLLLDQCNSSLLATTKAGFCPRQVEEGFQRGRRL